MVCVFLPLILFSIAPAQRLAFGQMINTTTPFVSVGDSYFENFVVGFGFSVPGGRGPGSRVVGLGPNGQLTPNIVFRQNNGAIPPFGGFNPGAGATIGFGRRGPGGGGFNLGLSLAKGNVRTLSMQAPSITTMNGASGSIFNGTTRPFVVGNIPVIGRGPGIGPPTILGPSWGGRTGPSYVPEYENGVTRALKMGALNIELPDEPATPRKTSTKHFSNPNSTAAQGDLSVEAIKAKRQHDAALASQQIETMIADADSLLKQGNRIGARIKLREAKELTDDESMLRKLDRLIKVTRTSKKRQ